MDWCDWLILTAQTAGKARCLNLFPVSFCFGRYCRHGATSQQVTLKLYLFTAKNTIFYSMFDFATTKNSTLLSTVYYGSFAVLVRMKRLPRQITFNNRVVLCFLVLKCAGAVQWYLYKTFEESMASTFQFGKCPISNPVLY